MPSYVAGSVAVSDAGVVTFTPSDPADSIAGILYTTEIATNDAFTVAEGGEVAADADRVPLLQFYALRSTNLAAALVPYLNANG